VVLLAERIAHCSVVIVLDMSAPGDALPTLQFWAEEIQKQVDAVINEILAAPGGAERVEAMRARSVELWRDHPDRDQIRPSLIPLMVIANKWDAFEDNFGEAEYRKLITRALRYFSLLYGASLVCTKHKDKSMMTTVRNLFYHYVFSTPAVRTVQTEYNKPLVVPATADSFAGIGKPPVVEGVSSESAADRWAGAIQATFPPSKGGKRETNDLSMVEAEQFAEEAVDELRRQKHDEMGKLRKEKALAEKMRQQDSAYRANT